MSNFVRLLLPDLSYCIDKKYFRGYISISEERDITIYITKFLNAERFSYTKGNIIYGCFKCCKTRESKKSLKFKKVQYINNYVILDGHKRPHITKLIVAGREIVIDNNCILIKYDQDAFRRSETMCNSNDYFYNLQTHVKNEFQLVHKGSSYEPIFENPSWLSATMFGQYLFNYIQSLIWLLKSIKIEHKILLKEGNLLFAIILDLILGYYIVQLISSCDMKVLSTVLMEVLENLVNSLYSLLKWLMGAPAGLKLNNAFNKMLGKYFSYHIQLWWLFLDVTGEKLDIILHICQYLGYIGFTFQAALLSDMICIATFHAYCIYVYAARLFNIQISGLIALLRLFVGRKFNPLRGGIDSCEYTNQELFVGTVAFTILLLLLPTTAMYYTVFTLFRLLSLVVQSMLAKIINFMQTLPVYLLILWFFKSRRLAGNVFIEVVTTEQESPLVLRVKLFPKSITELISNFKPPVGVLKQVEWGNLFSNIVTGRQII